MSKEQSRVGPWQVVNEKMDVMLKRAQVIVDECPSKAQQDNRELQLMQIKLLAEVLSALWRLEERK